MKKSSAITLVTGIVSVVFVSCNNTKKGNGTDLTTLYEIDYSHSDQANTISTIVDSVEFIPLHGSIENPISGIDELQVTDQGIYILDRRRNKLHAYSKDGNQLFTLHSMGHAQQEYLEIACIAVTDSSVFIVDNFGKKINEYGSDNGMFKRSYNAPIVIGAIRPLDNGGFILAELPMEGVNQIENSDGNRLYIADSSFRIKHSIYPYDNHRDKIGMGRFLSDNDSVIIYSSTGYNGFSKISAKDGNFIGNVSVNTARPFNNIEIAEMDKSKARDYVVERRWQFLTTTPMMAGKYICLSVKDEDTAEPCIYDEKSGKLYFNDNISMHNNMIAPDDAYGNSFYIVYNFGGEFLDDQLDMGFNRPPLVADSIIRNDGAVLLRYRMKID